MTLTTKQMDDINYLLTEVSLELLGNKFYDINGQCRSGLTELYSTDLFSKLPSDYEAHTSDLVKALNIADRIRGEEPLVDLTLPEKEDIFDTPAQLGGRRQSTGNDSLLVPMKRPRIAASVQQRRNTVYVDISSKKRSDILPTAKKPSSTQSQSVHKNCSIKTLQKKAQSLPRSSQTAIIISPPDNPVKKVDSVRVNYKVQLIKEKIALEYARMIQISSKNREDNFVKTKHRMESMGMNEYDIVDEFHKKELENLSRESSILIEFVKFIRTDPVHEIKMQEIAKNILLVKDQM